MIEELNIRKIFQTYLHLVWGSQVNPTVNSGTSPSPAAPGCCFYRLKALSNNVVIASATNIGGTAYTGFTAITILQGDYLDLPMSTYTLTSGTVLEYQRKIDFFNPATMS